VEQTTGIFERTRRILKDQEYEEQGISFGMPGKEQLCNQRIEETGQEELENACQHVERLEQHYYEQEGTIEKESIITEDNALDSSDINDKSVTCQKAKVCQEWENWKRTKDSHEEDNSN
jgi:hypothetical protein